MPGKGTRPIREVADVVIVLVQPETGDELQWEKAGQLEIADIVVVHKADLPSAERVESQLRELLNLPGCRPIPGRARQLEQRAGGGGTLGGGGQSHWRGWELGNKGEKVEGPTGQGGENHVDRRDHAPAGMEGAVGVGAWWAREVLEGAQNDEEPKGEGRCREHEVDCERVGYQTAASGGVVVGRHVGKFSPVLEKLNVDFEQDQEDQQTAGEGELELFMSLVAIAVFDRVEAEGKCDQNEDHSDDDDIEHEWSPPRQEPVDRKALLHRGPHGFSARLQKRGRASRSPSLSLPPSSSSSRIDDTV